MKFKNLGLGVILLGLFSLNLFAASSDDVHNDSESVKSKFISAFGDATVARAEAQSVCSYQDTMVTNGQIGTLGGAGGSITLVPAPGAGKMHIPCGGGVYAFLKAKSGSTAWSGAATLPIKYNGTNVTFNTITNAHITASTDDARWYVPVSVTGLAPLENTALVLMGAGNPLTSGNTHLAVRVYYQTIGASTVGGSLIYSGGV